MAEKVKLSKDGNTIDFVQSESIPGSVKKFRQSPEIEGFYRFIFENDLQKEAFEILEKIVGIRKAKKKSEKQEAVAATKKAEVVEKITLKKEAAAKPKEKAAKKIKVKAEVKAPVKSAKKVATPKAKPTVKAKVKAKKVTPVSKKKPVKKK